MTDTNVINTPVGKIKFNNFSLQELGFLAEGPGAVISKLLEIYQKQPLNVLITLLKAGRIGYEFEYGEDDLLDFKPDVKAIRTWVAAATIEEYKSIMDGFLEAVQVPSELQRIAANQPADGEKKSPKHSKK